MEKKICVTENCRNEQIRMSSYCWNCTEKRLEKQAQRRRDSFRLMVSAVKMGVKNGQ